MIAGITKDVTGLYKIQNLGEATESAEHFHGGD
jgi:hypothetical protein